MSDVICLLEEIAKNPQLLQSKVALNDAVADAKLDTRIEKALLAGDVSSLATILNARNDMVCGILPADEPEDEPAQEPEKTPEETPEDDKTKDTNSFLKRIA